MDEQEKLSEAYSDLKEKYIMALAKLSRYKNINQIYRRYFNHIMDEDTSLEEMISEAHDELIEKYAQRGAQLRFLQGK